MRVIGRNYAEERNGEKPAGRIKNIKFIAADGIVPYKCTHAVGNANTLLINDSITHFA